MNALLKYFEIAEWRWLMTYTRWCNTGLIKLFAFRNRHPVLAFWTVGIGGAILFNSFLALLSYSHYGLAIIPTCFFMTLIWLATWWPQQKHALA